MASSTTELINRLAGERSHLYSVVSGDGRPVENVRQRIAQLSRELEALWQHRRREKAGTRQGIDLVVHRAYERAYGPGYEDAINPPPVANPEEDVAKSVA